MSIVSACPLVRAPPSRACQEAAQPQVVVQQLVTSQQGLNRSSPHVASSVLHLYRLAVCRCTGVSADVDPWQRARTTYQAGAVFEGTIRGVNRGGVIVDCWGVSGFIPNSKVSFSGTLEEGMTVRALFVEVDEVQNRLILSQTHVQQAELLKTITPGSTVEGKVSWIEAYGAFVDIELPEGRTASGLVHKSELSWSEVKVPESVVSTGENVKCVVLDVDAPRGRVSLSLRQTRPDPLKQSLASILVPPDGSSTVQWVEGEAPLRGLEAAVERLKEAEGVRGVVVGRQAAVAGHVSQELEIWLGKEHDGAFDLVARSANLVQELEVESSCSKDEMRVLLDRVMNGQPPQDPAHTSA